MSWLADSAGDAAPLTGGTPVSTRTYAVFISYRHADNKAIGRQWASWLHHSLETYEVPPELVGRPNLRKEPVPASLFPVFRDEEELPADADLDVNIRRALERSGLLVVVCSPRAVTSPYVDEEIRAFKELGRSDRILALLIDGEPDAKDPALECLPQSLRFGKPRADGTIDWEAPTQPIAADARPEGRAAEGWTTAAAYEQALEDEAKLPRRQIAHLTSDYEKRLELAKLKVVAGALGVDLGELTKRNQVFALAKARRRARVLTAWLTAVGILAIAALAAGVIAFRNQREAERQRDRALREVYVNTVRIAAAHVDAGRLGEARKALFRAPAAHRAWEWWYLMARCGPAPMTLTEYAAVDGKAAAAMKARLDEEQAIKARIVEEDVRPGPRRGSGGVVLEESYRGRGGERWQVRRVAGAASILLNAFHTGMYGSVVSVALGESGLVYWRNGDDEDTHKRPSEMATGDEVADNTDHVAFLRERYIVADLRAEPGDPDARIDLSTWGDEAGSEVSHLEAIETAGPDAVAITVYGEESSVSYAYDFKKAALTAGAPSESARPQWDGDSVVDVERGPAGPLALSAWEFGNVRLRDGRTGRVIGESIAGQPEELFHSGGGVAIVPGTEWIAGYFWWEKEIVAGVADLRHHRLLARFEKAPDMVEQQGTVPASVGVSPDGREAVLRIQTRGQHYLAAWDVQSGKRVYGPFASGIGPEEEQSERGLPEYAWSPDGSFVAILQSNGVTELRRSFAAAPFAKLEGIGSGMLTVRETGDPSRVLIGDWVVDRARWERVVEFPVLSWVSPDGKRAVLRTRPGVIEVVRPGFRHAPANLRDSVLLHQIRATPPPM